MTALLWSAYNGHKDVVELLLDIGADISERDKASGQSPYLLSQRYHCDENGVILLNIKYTMFAYI